MARRIREFDWASTPLGPMHTWPQSLRTSIRLMLNSRYPMFLWWGPDLINFYNSDYVPILGDRHPAALGRPASQIWAEIWDVVGPQARIVMEEGRPTWNESMLLVMTRYGYVEETYFSFSYGPAHREDGQVGGVLCICTEDTAKVLSRRRLKTLRDLGERTLSQSRTAEDAIRAAAITVAENPNDVPFALIYLLGDDGETARLAGSVRVDEGSAAAPSVINLTSGRDLWGFRSVLQTGRPQMLEELTSRFGRLSAGAWTDDVTSRAIVLPLARSGIQDYPAGFLVVGLSPRLQFDDEYSGFLDLAAGHIATGIANARAYQDERNRADALAEIDRAKTLFFSNVSHEFRTPLTLMLGPLEDALRSDLAADERERLVVAHRNSLRLLKLVNSLLDFSRIEAGRTQACYQPTDLAALTSELVSNFRSACERAGLSLVVDCPPLPEPVYVDRDMWEKIVLNLLSNAFKFTFEGALSVVQRVQDGQVELSVADTGVGVPDHELPRLFERFHRIEGQKARTHEGSGIGLALVHELVKLHRGTISAQSEVGRGTTFSIHLPCGKAHLPADRVGVDRSLESTSGAADAYVQEALRWLPDAAPVVEQPCVNDPPPSNLGIETATRILLADDNSDMRAYVCRLLETRCEVQTVADGEAALKAIHAHRPDLVLADIMMPRLDGFGLLRAIRGHPELRDLPVILLSARAGEESRVEGLRAGADDYLVKPFSARELVARVSAHLGLSRIRRDTTRALREHAAWMRGQHEALAAAVDGATLDKSLGVLVRTAIEALGASTRAAFYLVNDQGTSIQHVVGMPHDYAKVVEVVPIGPDSPASGLAIHRGEPVLTADVQEDPGWESWRWLAERFDFRACWSFPIHTRAGKFIGTLAIYWPHAREATQRDLELASLLTNTASIIISRHMEAEVRKNAEQALRESEERLRAALQAGKMAYWTWNEAEHVLVASETMGELIGMMPDEILRGGRDGFALVHPDDRNRHRELVERRGEEGKGWHSIFRIIRPRDGQIAWLEERAEVSHDPTTGERRIAGLAWDITEQKQAAERQKILLAELQHRTRNLLGVVRSITDRTLARSGSLQGFRASFRDRLEALARVNGLLSRLNEGDRITFSELIRTELSGLGVTDALGHAGQVSLHGPENVRLRSSTVQTLALGLHELATNALKYGALSRPEGRLSIRWSLKRPANGERRLEVEWRESDISVQLGPDNEPERKGYGRELIERALPYQLQAETSYAITAEGVRCTISLPISAMQEGAAHA